jgi:programmed cell death protein 5
MDYLTQEQIEEMEKIERIKKIVLSKLLTKKAMERLGRIKLVKPELANQLELYLVQLYQAGQIKNMITDEQIKGILESISTKTKFRIKR